MRQSLRITAVAAEVPSALEVAWQDGSRERVELAGWIATGGELLAPLADPARFAAAAVGDFGASITWDEGAGELAIDAHHLRLIAAEQRPFAAADVVRWQQEEGLSNREAADFLGVALSTWYSYKAGAPIPAPVAMILRAARRDPVVLQAHLRPRRVGRPKRDRRAARASARQC